MTNDVNIGREDTSPAARVSIIARMVPVISLCLPLIGEASCAVLLLGVLNAMRSAEMAGIASVTGGMAAANLAMTISLYLGIFVGPTGIVVMAMRALTATMTISPSASFFALVNLLTLIPLIFLWEAQSYFFEGINGRNISLVAPNIFLFLKLTIGASAALAPILLIASFIPLTSLFRARQKWVPVVLLVLIEVAMIGTAVVFQVRTSWLHRASLEDRL